MRDWLVEDVNRAVAWLKNRRWYGDKSRPVAAVDATELLTISIEDLTASFLLVELQFEDGGAATYFLPAARQGESIVEAVDDDRFLRWLAAGFASNRRLDLPAGGSLEWSRSSQADSGEWWTLHPQVLTGEQSNTSMRFGDRAVAKIFRKWQPGLNPDSEIVEFISSETAFRCVPAYLGSIRLLPAGDDETVEISTVQAFVVNEGDCWKWLPPALAAAGDDEMPELVSAIELLGQRTGELHAALASGTTPEFVLEVIGDDDASTLRARVESELGITCRMLAASGRLPGGEVEHLEDGLRERLGEAGSLVGSHRTRVHGDYHLGQVLRSSDDFVIIDFEGEPSRPMVERRQKHSPLKDVAGMLRSLDYAVAAASEDASDHQRLRIREFGDAAGAAFRNGYWQGIAGAPDGLLPTTPDAFEAALDLFMIEKALYETRYELDNRPDWLDIPLGALRTIAQMPDAVTSRE